MTTNKPGPGRPRAAKATPAVAESVPDTEVKAQSTADADQRLRELEERFTALAKAQEDRIRELEAAAKQAQAYAPVDSYDDKEGDLILLHFVEDGHTAQGRVWFRGQEIELTVGDEAWKDSLDRKGGSWLSMTEDDQIERYGKVYFRRGPWRGKTYLDGEWVQDGPPMSELERADKLERNRQRAAPRLPDLTEE